MELSRQETCPWDGVGAVSVALIFRRKLMKEPLPPELRLDPRNTFDEFVVGPHNRFPQAAAQAVADNLGKAYNPLFIYGPVGLGKTHLMHAIGHRVFAKNAKAKILYVTAEQFMTEVIEVLR